MRARHTLLRRGKALLFGALAGLCALALLLPPLYAAFFWRPARGQSLTPAGGAAEFHSVAVQLTVLLGGSPADGMSVSPDMLKWYTPLAGAVTLELPPGEYDFCAAYENRTVTARHTVGEASAGLVLDVSLAPEAPPLLIFDAQKGGALELPLDISGAESVELINPPNGLAAVRRGAQFYLAVDGEMLPYGFHAVELIAQNGHGRSVTWLGVRVARAEPPVEIYTVEDLEAVRRNLSGSYILMNDLDMSAVDDWQPIGGQGYPFTGVFDGGGHEITGFHFTGELVDGAGFCFFAHTKNAELRNIIFREPLITPAASDDASSCAVIVAAVDRGLMQNCAVIGGLVAPEKGGAHGAVEGNSGIILSVFNSADIICSATNRSMKNTGGVIGGTTGYAAFLANEGEVYGTHLQGGVCGWQYGGLLLRCVNSGYIWGNLLVGEFPSGGVTHTVNDRSMCAYGYFVRGQAALGAKSFNASVVNSLFPIERGQLRDPGAMPLLGAFGGERPDWAFASLDANGPVPFGIFARQAEAPAPVRDGARVALPAVEGLVYFYTTDGGDPRVSGERAESLELALARGQTLAVYSARQGCRDSEIIYITQGGTAQ